MVCATTFSRQIFGNTFGISPLHAVSSPICLIPLVLLALIIFREDNNNLWKCNAIFWASCNFFDPRFLSSLLPDVFSVCHSRGPETKSHAYNAAGKIVAYFKLCVHLDISAQVVWEHTHARVIPRRVRHREPHTRGIVSADHSNGNPILCDPRNSILPSTRHRSYMTRVNL